METLPLAAHIVPEYVITATLAVARTAVSLAHWGFELGFSRG
jgi:hypothetical protein